MRTLKSLLVAALWLALPAAAFAADGIPIRDFVRHPQYSATKISPDGRYLALTVQQDDVMSLAVLRLEDMKVIRITRLTNGESVSAFHWVGPNRLMYTSAQNFGTYAEPFGTGVWYAMDADGGRARTLDSNGLEMLDPLADDESHALMQFNDDSANGRNKVVSIDTMTGRWHVLSTAPRTRCGLVVDRTQRTRYANCLETKDALVGYDEKVELYRLDDGDTWTRIDHVQEGGPDLAVTGIASDGRVYAFSSDRKRPGAFGLLDPATSAFQPLYQDPVADIHDFLDAADARTVVGLVTMAGAPHVELVDRQHPDAAVYAAMSNAFPGELVSITSATSDGRKMVVAVYSDTDPGQLYLFDRDTGSVRFLMKSRPDLDPGRMSHVQAFSFKARDGQMLYGYMTMPSGGSHNLPTIINPHGGPIGIRDDWGFNSEAQMLASRGYLVVQVNFRGSGGYGKAFEDAGHGEWGEKMQDDLTDATRWVAEQKYADPKRICIYGASYGAYAAMVGAAREQGLYQCAVGYVGVYDLGMLYSRGDATTKESKRFLNRTIGKDASDLRSRSPIYMADRIHVPVFLADGLKDQRAPHQHTDEMRKALKAAGHPPEVVIEEPAEMHGFYQEDANLNLYTKMLSFFDKYIGPGVTAAGSH